MIDFKILLNGSEYSFLRENEHLKDNIIMLGLGGSHAYGTNVETSDVDLRGIAMNKANDLLGFGNFEQFNNDATDTVIYSFNKAVRLFLDCNPNMIEMLGLKKEHYVMLSPVGEMLLENRKLFLSQKAGITFGGYADGQLRRLQNALAHDSYDEKEKAEHIKNALKSAMNSFSGRYGAFEDGAINISVGDDNQLCVDFNLKNYPLRQTTGILNEMLSIVRNYDKLNYRNRKKDDAHLNKHAMHLIRLYMMCIDIYEKEEIVTYREAEHDLLMDIRNGKYQKADGCFNDDFFILLNDYKNRLEYAKANTSLPKEPDYKKIEEFVVEANRQSILKEGS